METQGTPRTRRAGESRRAIGILFVCGNVQKNEWSLIWTGADPLPTVQHLCSGLYGPVETNVSEYVTLTYAPTSTPGMEAARCERCRVAWVRAAES